MNIIIVDRGADPPTEKPRIIVKGRRDGGFEFYGVSASLDLQLDPRVFASRDDAQTAAISWASAHNYGDVYLVSEDA